jgi:hypothetical protein
MTEVKLAFDRSTVRTIDADGRLHVSKSHISKCGVNLYLGKEVPGWEGLGLKPDQIYRMLRDPGELAKAVNTFARMQIQSEHVHTTVENPRPDLIVGAVGSDVSFNAPYLDADLCIWDAEAIAGIETGVVRELSCAYRYIPLMNSGEYEGQPYDGIMTEIQGSHLCLVPVGRAGEDVIVADSNPFKETNMAKCAADEEDKKIIKAEEKEKIVAKDEEDDKEGDKKDKVAKDKEDDEDEKDEKKEKVAKDEDDNKMSKEEVKAAMDGLRKEMREAEQARRDVRAIVGDVIAMDSASEIYGFALDHMKVDRADVTGAPALRALFKVASGIKPVESTVIAQDSAGLVKMFPNASRFRNA